MRKPITIAIDAMGGENSPDKTIEGISHHIDLKTGFYKGRQVLDPKE